MNHIGEYPHTVYAVKKSRHIVPVLSPKDSPYQDRQTGQGHGWSGNHYRYHPAIRIAFPRDRPLHCSRGVSCATLGGQAAGGGCVDDIARTGIARKRGHRHAYRPAGLGDMAVILARARNFTEWPAAAEVL